jgi:hypothetical protein
VIGLVPTNVARGGVFEKKGVPGSRHVGREGRLGQRRTIGRDDGNGYRTRNLMHLRGGNRKGSVREFGRKLKEKIDGRVRF